MDVKLFVGDCLDILPTMKASSIDTVITDPPYGLNMNNKSWDQNIPGQQYWESVYRVAKPGAFLLSFGGTKTFHRLMCAIEDAGWLIRDCISWVYATGKPKSHNIEKATGRHNWHGYGTGLKPSWEPIIVAMKPIDKTFSHNALKHNLAGLWIDGARVPIPTDASHRGRWPANFIHDGSDEVTSLFPRTKSGTYSGNFVGEYNSNTYGQYSNSLLDGAQLIGDEGSAARFFYCAKSSPSERNAGLDNSLNSHPTVKPIDLMRYLCRLTKSPSKGNVLDLFMGTGSTGCGSVMEGRPFFGIENNPDTASIAAERISHWGGPLLTNVDLVTI